MAAKLNKADLILLSLFLSLLVVPSIFFVWNTFEYFDLQELNHSFFKLFAKGTAHNILQSLLSTFLIVFLSKKIAIFSFFISSFSLKKFISQSIGILSNLYFIVPGFVVCSFITSGALFLNINTGETASIILANIFLNTLFLTNKSLLGLESYFSDPSQKALLLSCMTQAPIRKDFINGLIKPIESESKKPFILLIFFWCFSSLEIPLILGNGKFFNPEALLFLNLSYSASETRTAFLCLIHITFGYFFYREQKRRNSLLSINKRKNRLDFSHSPTWNKEVIKSTILYSFMLSPILFSAKFFFSNNLAHLSRINSLELNSILNSLYLCLLTIFSCNTISLIFLSASTSILRIVSGLFFLSSTLLIACWEKTPWPDFFYEKPFLFACLLMTISISPFFAQIILSQKTKIPAELVALKTMTGASSFQFTRYVYWPMSKEIFPYIACLSFAFTWGNYSVSQLFLDSKPTIINLLGQSKYVQNETYLDLYFISTILLTTLIFLTFKKALKT